MHKAIIPARAEAHSGGVPPSEMPQLYLFIIALALLTGMIVRRKKLYKKEQKARFKEKISKRVDELKEMAEKEPPERFKEQYKKEQKKKKDDPQTYNIRLKKAEVAISKQKWEEAKKLLIQAMAMTKVDTTAAFKLAFVYQQSDELGKAESLYRRLLEIRPKDPEVYSSLGQILTQKKRYKQAIKAYTRAIDLDEKNDQNLIALGRLYFILTHYESAVECFKKANKLKPRETNYLFLIAKACQNNHDEQAALFAYERILTFEPYNEVAKEAAQDLRIKLHEESS